MLVKSLGFLRIAILLVFPTGVFATGSATPVVLEPITQSDATLSVSGPNGNVTYSVAAIEEFPTYRLTTTTPWRTEPAVFEGVMLADVLAANDLYDATAIRVTAENDYVSELPRDVLTSLPILVATRVNGQPISRRERGPILFVIEDTLYQTSSIVRERYLVWMAARIEPAF